MDQIKDNIEKHFDKDVTIVPDKLNVYQKGDFFKDHIDTPRGVNMFGSLVICLPVYHIGGKFVLYDKKDNIVYKSCWGDTTFIHWIAFNSEYRHQVLPVLEGNRLTLTFNLYSKKTSNITQIDKPINLIDTPEFDFHKKGAFATSLHHLYPIDTRQNSNNIIDLKGSDKCMYELFKNKYNCDVQLYYKIQVTLESHADINRNMYQIFEEAIVNDSIESNDNEINDCDGDDYNEYVMNFLQKESKRKYSGVTCDKWNVYTFNVFVPFNEKYIEIDYQHEGDLLEVLNENVCNVMYIPVTWINNSKIQSRIGTYLAYGNEASIDHIYASGCLVFEK